MPRHIKTLVDDLTDKRFGAWTAIRFLGHNLDGKRIWHCKCDCGTEKDIVGSQLRNGHTKGCKACIPARRQKGKKPCKLSDTQVDLLVTSYVSGETTTVLARKFGINYVSVRNYVIRRGIKPRTIQDHGKRCRRVSGQAAFNGTYKRYKAMAKYKGLSFDITKEKFKQITQCNYYYCGSSPSNETTTNNGSYIYSGIDRIDSNLGYFVGNVVPCCIVCNRAKMRMQFEEFVEWIEKLSRNLLSLSAIDPKTFAPKDKVNTCSYQSL